MSAIHKFQTTWSNGGQAGLQSTQNVTGDIEANMPAFAIAGSATTELDVSFLFAKLQSYILLSTVDCTLKTNNSGTPDNTIPLVAGVAKTFFAGGNNLFTVNVTKIFAVVAGATPGVLDIRTLSNA